MLRKLRRWAKLAPSDRMAVIEAWLLLLLASLAVRWLDLARSKRLLGAILPRRRPAAEPTPPAAARLQRLIGMAASNHLASVKCLERSLVLCAMLSRRGHDVELRIGVRRQGAKLEAHAWVESDGEPIADDERLTGGYSALLPTVSAR